MIYGLVTCSFRFYRKCGHSFNHPSGALAANYDISFVSGTLTVDKAFNITAKMMRNPDSTIQQLRVSVIPDLNADKSLQIQL